MIQFNLLPDLKMKYIKAKRFKHTAMVISFIVTASSLAIFIFLFMTVYVFQKNHINAVSKEISEAQVKLENTKDLNKVLTIQNQLNSLPALHSQKPEASRLLKYTNQITPNAVFIGKIVIDFTEKTIIYEGIADTLSSTNKFVDTLKFATFKDKLLKKADQDALNKEGKNIPFSEVVLDDFELNDEKGGIPTYKITLKYDSAIFDNNKDIEITIPNITSTRSSTEKPQDLFKAIPKKDEKAQ